MHVLIAGCGWLGAAVARRLIARGDRVTGLRRDPARAARLRALGVEPLALDLGDADAASRIPTGIDAILALQSAKGEASYRQAYVHANRTLLEAARRGGIQAFVYTSSTGVFGHRDGSEVDEATPPAPASPSGELLLEAEGLMREAAATGLPARVLRLSGLYGPDRLWLLERVAQGAMAPGPQDGAWMNFCHQDDAALTLLAVLDRGRDGAVYHATDACPMRRGDVIALVREGLGLPAQARDAAAPDSGRRIQGLETRRELGLRLCWPSLKEGLAPFFAP